jgi:hypothetical protein
MAVRVSRSTWLFALGVAAVTLVAWGSLWWVARALLLVLCAIALHMIWEEARNPVFPAAPAALRVLNQLFALCGFNSWRWVRLDMQTVHARATEMAGGLTDFGDEIDG